MLCWHLKFVQRWLSHKSSRNSTSRQACLTTLTHHSASKSTSIPKHPNHVFYSSDCCYSWSCHGSLCLCPGLCGQMGVEENVQGKIGKCSFIWHLAWCLMFEIGKFHYPVWAYFAWKWGFRPSSPPHFSSTVNSARVRWESQQHHQAASRPRPAHILWRQCQVSRWTL